MVQRKNKSRFKIGDKVAVSEPFGISTICFHGYIIRVDSVEKSWWKQIEPEYTVKKTDGGVQCYVRESWMTFIDPVNEKELMELGFATEKDYIRNGVAEHVKAADDMLCFLEASPSEDICDLELSAKGWLLLGLRAAGISEKEAEAFIYEKCNWAFGLLSRREAAEYFKEYRRRKSVKEE